MFATSVSAFMVKTNVTWVFFLRNRMNNNSNVCMNKLMNYFYRYVSNRIEQKHYNSRESFDALLHITSPLVLLKWHGSLFQMFYNSTGLKT